MPTTVAQDLTRIRQKLHDDGTLWPETELLRLYNDGYRQLLAASQALRRWRCLDIPGRHTYALTFEWEDGATSGSARTWSRMLAPGHARGSTLWEAEHLQGQTPSASLAGTTQEWERAFMGATDRHYRFSFLRDHQRPVALYWHSRRLVPLGVRELDALYTAWEQQTGMPRFWTTGLGRTRSIELYQIDTEYQQTWQLLDADAGIPRRLTGDRTYTAAIDPDLPLNRFAYTTSGERQALTTQPAAGVDVFGSGQAWFKGAAEASTSGHVAVFMDTLTVYKFFTDGGATLRYLASHDGGITFPDTHLTSAAPGPDLIGAGTALNPATGRRIVFVLNNANGLFISSDLSLLPDTSTWTTTTFTGGAALSLGLGADPAQVCVVGQDAGSKLRIFVSTDTGATFPSVTDFVTDSIVGMRSTQLAASPSAGIWVVLNAVTGTVRRTTNNGTSWTLVQTLNSGSGTSGSGCILRVSATRMVACFRSQIATSDDAGVTWTQRQNLVALNGDLVAFADFGGNILGAVALTLLSTAAANALAFRSIDGGTTWAAVAVDAGIVIGGTPKITGIATLGLRAVVTGVDGVNSAQQYWYATSGPLTTVGSGWLTGIGVRITLPRTPAGAAVVTATSRFGIQPWELDLLNGATTFRVGERIGTYVWEQHHGGALIVLPMGLARRLTSPDRQYLAQASDLAASPLLSGRIVDWRSSDDAVLALEVVVPREDLTIEAVPALLPEPMQKYLRYYVLGMALVRPGEGRNPVLAAHYLQRVARGQAFLKRLAAVTSQDVIYRRDEFAPSVSRPPRVQLPPEFPEVWR